MLRTQPWLMLLTHWTFGSDNMQISLGEWGHRLLSLHITCIPAIMNSLRVHWTKNQWLRKRLTAMHKTDDPFHLIIKLYIC